ncbi:hypothetical protein TNCV_4710051 [Trichonephila clavipes]|nr:hypothetical protein TNCV_4710051 [Trichonephila clavipes]
MCETSYKHSSNVSDTLSKNKLDPSVIFPELATPPVSSTSFSPPVSFCKHTGLHDAFVDPASSDSLFKNSKTFEGNNIAASILHTAASIFFFSPPFNEIVNSETFALLFSPKQLVNTILE